MGKCSKISLQFGEQPSYVGIVIKPLTVRIPIKQLNGEQLGSFSATANFEVLFSILYFSVFARDRNFFKPLTQTFGNEQSNNFP